MLGSPGSRQGPPPVLLVALSLIFDGLQLLLLSQNREMGGLAAVRAAVVVHQAAR